MKLTLGCIYLKINLHAKMYRAEQHGSVCVSPGCLSCVSVSVSNFVSACVSVCLF